MPPLALALNTIVDAFVGFGGLKLKEAVRGDGPLVPKTSLMIGALQPLARQANPQLLSIVCNEANSS